MQCARIGAWPKLALFPAAGAVIKSMNSTSNKKAPSAVSDPLENTAILQQVFTFLPGNWLLLGAVCRDWQAVYAGMQQQQVCSLTSYEYRKLVTCDCKTTLYSAVLASPATVRLGNDCGLWLHAKNKQLQLIANQLADIETLTALQDLGMSLSQIAVQAAASSGRLNTLQHLLTEERCCVPCGLSYFAARSGSISMLSWLRAERVGVFNHNTCSGAAQGGHLAALQHLRSEGCDWNTEYIARYAASSGSVEVVEWLQQQGIVLDNEVLAWAAAAGQTAICEHLLNLGCELGADACNETAAYGEVSMLRWLREQGCSWDVSRVCMSAAGRGLTDILDYVIEQGEVLGAELLKSALCKAGACNKLQAAQWLRQRGAEWPELLYYRESVHETARKWSGESLA
jgi:hypothetical protein